MKSLWIIWLGPTFNDKDPCDEKAEDTQERRGSCDSNRSSEATAVLADTLNFNRQTAGQAGSTKAFILTWPLELGENEFLPSHKACERCYEVPEINLLGQCTQNQLCLPWRCKEPLHLEMSDDNSPTTSLACSLWLTCSPELPMLVQGLHYSRVPGWMRLEADSSFAHILAHCLPASFIPLAEESASGWTSQKTCWLINRSNYCCLCKTWRGFSFGGVLVSIEDWI